MKHKKTIILFSLITGSALSAMTSFNPFKWFRGNASKNAASQNRNVNMLTMFHEFEAPTMSATANLDSMHTASAGNVTTLQTSNPIEASCMQSMQSLANTMNNSVLKSSSRSMNDTEKAHLKTVINSDIKRPQAELHVFNPHAQNLGEECAELCEKLQQARTNYAKLSASYQDLEYNKSVMKKLWEKGKSVIKRSS